MATASKLLTYEDWLQLPENESGREECVNGVIEKMPPAKSTHAFIVENLADQLRDALDRRLVRVMTTDFGLVIRRHPLTQRTPDIAVYERASMVIEDGYFHSPPQLAVEVLSPANTPQRVREKLADYLLIGVPEIWVVSPQARTISTYVLENNDYTETQLPYDAVTAPARFPSVTVGFAAIWPDL